MKLIKLDKNYDIKVKSQVTHFLTPDFIYIPIENRPLPFKRNQEIKKEESIFTDVFSPISGNIIGVSNGTFYDGQTKKCLVLKNNYQEKVKNRVATRKKLSTITIENIKNEIKRADLQEKLLHLDSKHLIVCGIDEEPYIANEVFIQKENTKEILETLDALLKFYENATAHIIIKNIDSENIESYSNFLGTYQNIELHLVDDYYMIGEEQNIIKSLHIKEEYIYLKASDVYEIYYNLKKRKPIVEKYITITGDGIANPQVFAVKLGTKLMDILTVNYDLDFTKYDLYVNGLMRGKKINIANLIVTKEFDGILIMNKKKKEPKECIRCGKCIEICPIHSNPMMAYLTHKKVPCIECGLCSYICPSYIHLRKYLIGDSNE